MGEVNLSGEEENVVRIMTIHKSKGLEFPICIIGGMGHAIHVPDKKHPYDSSGYCDGNAGCG